MHELWLCNRILEIIQEQAASNQTYARVKVINLEVGELAAVEESALLFSFDVAAKGTIAENALLKFIIIQGKAWCEDCQKTIHVKRFFQACEFCNNHSLTITSGEEFRIHSMEVE